MRKVLRLILPILVCGAIVVAGAVNATSVMAEGVDTSGLEAVKCDGCPEDLYVVFKNITNTVLYIVGIVAVIMLIIGGIRYIVSGGDAKKVTDAKNTILYAIIGLIICFLAFAIVNFVIKSIPGIQASA